MNVAAFVLRISLPYKDEARAESDKALDEIVKDSQDMDLSTSRRRPKWFHGCHSSRRPFIPPAPAPRIRGLDYAMAIYKLADQRLGNREWALGCYSIADIHLFRLFWRFTNSLKPPPRGVSPISKRTIRA